MKGQEVEKEEKTGKFQWFLFVIFIPFLFTVALALVIATIAGVNVFDVAQKYGSNIPVVSKLFEEKASSPEQTLKESMLEQQAAMEEKTLKIKKLEAEIKNKQNEIDALKQEIERLNAQLEAEEEPASSSDEQKLTVEDIANMYGTMTPKNAAAIIPKMSDEEAVDILAAVGSDKAAAILEKMTPAEAAKYTALLAREAQRSD